MTLTCNRPVMMAQKAYFPVLNYDYAPDDLIRIGQIIADPKSPDKPIGRPFQPLPDVHSSYKDDWEKEKSRTLTGSVGVWAQFLALILGIGVDVAANFEREEGDGLKFKRLETSFIVPDKKYIEDSTKDLKDFLRENPRTRSVYMVTGVKIARGAEVVRKRVRGAGGEGNASIDATAMTGVPVSTGPKTSIAWRNVDSESFSGSSDFVFAYRLRKISIEANTGQVTENNDFVRGALYAGSWEDQDQEDYASSGDGDGDRDDLTRANTASKEFNVFVDNEDFGYYSPPSGFESVQVIDDEDDRRCKMLVIGN
jgi:hypothetical protein